MERFDYSKIGIRLSYIFLGCTLFFLLMLLSIGIFFVWPSKGHWLEIRFGWWVPPLMIFLGGLVIYQVIGIKKSKNYFVELGVDEININGTLEKWSEIEKVELKGGSGEGAVNIRTKHGTQYEVSSMLDHIQYVRGVILNHTRGAIQTGAEVYKKEISENAKVLIGVIQSWRKKGFDFQTRYDMLEKAGFGVLYCESLLGEAEYYEPFVDLAHQFLERVHQWELDGESLEARKEKIHQQGFGDYATNLLLTEGTKYQSVSSKSNQ